MPRREGRHLEGVVLVAVHVAGVPAQQDHQRQDLAQAGQVHHLHTGHIRIRGFPGTTKYIYKYNSVNNLGKSKQRNKKSPPNFFLFKTQKMLVGTVHSVQYSKDLKKGPSVKRN